MSELLVVVAVIGVLVILLLPAVQLAIEAARLSTCRSHMRQIGVAMQSHHDAYSRFPIGSGPAGETSGDYGHGNWRYWLLEYINQVPMSMTPTAGVLWSEKTASTNTALWAKFHVSAYHCPSSSAPEREFNSTSGIESDSHDYVGIMGANPDPKGRTDGVRFKASTYGYVYNNGMLLGSEGKTIGDCRDGVSHTMIVGEQSGNPSSNIRSNYQSSWCAGYNSEFPIGYWAPRATAGVMPIQYLGLTVIKGAPNIPDPIDGNARYKPAVPLKSYHAGGCHILLADGAVRFLSNNTSATVCRQLAVRDDGQTIDGY